MKEQRSFAESGRISPETKTQQSTNAWIGLSNRQTSSSSASVPTAAVPREAGSFGLHPAKGIPRNPQFLQPGVRPRALTVGAGLVGHTGAAEEAETFLTPDAGPAGALAGRAVVLAPGDETPQR